MRRASSGQALEADQRETADTGHVSVEHAAGDLYRIGVRGHELWADQPADPGVGDVAPSPTELFVASLASCVAFYAGRYLTRHGLDRAGLRVDAEFTMADDRPVRVRSVMLRVTVPREMNPVQQRALAAVVDHCTVHNSLRHPPSVGITIAAARVLR